MYRNNKKNGTAFEIWFRRALSEFGFWAHKLVENENGAPFDIIALKGGVAYAFDCKECSTERFPLSRVEENQILGMRKFDEAGGIAFFVFRCGSEIRVAGAKLLFKAIECGKKSINIKDFEPIEEWLS